MDKPALHGTGKSIRLFHWLNDLSTQYSRVNCIYLKKPNSLSIGETLPSNVQVLEITHNPVNYFTRWWRGYVLGLFYPSVCNRTWYYTLTKDDKLKIREALKSSHKILLFRLYLFPLIHVIKELLLDPKKIMLDLDDADVPLTRKLIWRQFKTFRWGTCFFSLVAYYYFRRYERGCRSGLQTLFYAHPGDRQYFSEKIPGVELIHFPNKIPLRDNASKSFTWHAPRILFVGALSYFPNEDAIQWLKQDIWPGLLKLIPRATLVIAGSSPSESLVRKINAMPQVELRINPPTMESIFKDSDILIVPLRMGGGTRIKILEAFSYKLPVVSTTRGASGIMARQGHEILLADSTSDLIQACYNLVSQHQNASLLTDNAFIYYVDHFSYKAHV